MQFIPILATKKKLPNQLANESNGVDMVDKIFDVIAPKEKQIQIRNGKRKNCWS